MPNAPEASQTHPRECPICHKPTCDCANSLSRFAHTGFDYSQPRMWHTYVTPAEIDEALKAEREHYERMEERERFNRQFIANPKPKQHP